MSASYDQEKNVFIRGILGRLWETVAKLEAGDGTPRLAAARQAVEEAQSKVAEVGEPCVKDASLALDWALGTKQSLERRYLSSVDLLGEQNIGTKVVDAEVMVLRDAIDTLERRMKACPKQYFGPGER
jgi:hypothetical protein